MILDSATPMLNELLMVSNGYAIDALNYASVKLQSGMQKKSRSYGQSHFGMRETNGRRLLAGSHQKGIKGRHFSRFSHSTGDEQHGLDEFIKFRVYEKTLKSVVGFIDTKGFSANLYKDGRKYGSRSVKGQGGVKEIGEKMENGGRFSLSKKQKGLFYASGWGKAASRGYVVREARPVVQPTFQSMIGKIDSIFRDKYAQALSAHSAKTFQPQKRTAS